MKFVTVFALLFSVSAMADTVVTSPQVKKALDGKGVRCVADSQVGVVAGYLPTEFNLNTVEGLIHFDVRIQGVVCAKSGDRFQWQGRDLTAPIRFVSRERNGYIHSSQNEFVAINRAFQPMTVIPVSDEVSVQNFGLSFNVEEAIRTEDLRNFARGEPVLGQVQFFLRANNVLIFDNGERMNLGRRTGGAYILSFTAQRDTQTGNLRLSNIKVP
jgi:hypothetical protein